VASEGLPAAFGEHVMRPAPNSYSTTTDRRSDTSESAEILHAIVPDRTSRLGIGESTERKKTSSRWQSVEYTQVLILAGR